ncbi:PALP domain-containing protein, partial [Haematococcus lacustris]
ALVDDWVLLDEEEIADAMLLMLQKQGKLVEGAAGVALAAVTKLKDRLAGLRVAVIVCGGNVALDTLSQLLQRHKA